MRLFVIKGIYLLLLVACCSLTAATLPEWKIVPGDSHLTFSATQNDAPITGEFKQFSGDIYFDRNNMQKNKVNIVVNIGSLSSSYQDLTATLKTPAWFDAAVFPKAEFTATEFTKTGNSTYQAKGLLKIRDHSVPTIMTFEDKTPTANDKVRVVGSTILKRTAFGVGQGEWASTKEVKDAVTVNFDISAVKK